MREFQWSRILQKSCGRLQKKEREVLNQDNKEMLQILQKHNVDHILVGAYALAAQGYPRNTLDIDIWVDPTSENSSKVYKALAQFGAPLHDINVNTFKDKGIAFQIGVAPRRIDIITEISQRQFFQTALICYDKEPWWQASISRWDTIPSFSLLLSILISLSHFKSGFLKNN